MATRCCWPPESWSIQRLPEEQDLGLVHQGTGDGYPLLLAAGKLVDPALAVPFQVHQLQHGLHLLFDLLLGGLLDPQAEGDVVEDVQVREQGVLLEHGVDLPLVGGDLGDVRAVHQDLACGGHDEARDEPQHGGLSAAGRTQERQKLPVVDIQVHMVQRQIPVILLGNVPQLDQSFAHDSLLPLFLRRKGACSPKAPSPPIFRC